MDAGQFVDYRGREKQVRNEDGQQQDPWVQPHEPREENPTDDEERRKEDGRLRKDPLHVVIDGDEWHGYGDDEDAAGEERQDPEFTVEAPLQGFRRRLVPVAQCHQAFAPEKGHQDAGGDENEAQVRDGVKEPARDRLLADIGRQEGGHLGGPDVRRHELATRQRRNCFLDEAHASEQRDGGNLGVEQVQRHDKKHDEEGREVPGLQAFPGHEPDHVPKRQDENENIGRRIVRNDGGDDEHRGDDVADHPDVQLSEYHHDGEGEKEDGEVRAGAAGSHHVGGLGGKEKGGEERIDAVKVFPGDDVHGDGREGTDDDKHPLEQVVQAGEVDDSLIGTGEDGNAEA